MLNELKELKELNPFIPFIHANDKEFKRYGKLLSDFPIEEAPPEWDKTPIPYKETKYVASIPAWEDHNFKETIQYSFFGAMDIQIGYCNGDNQLLNGFEYHKSSEILVAATPLVLLVQSLQDTEINEDIESSNTVAIFVPAYNAVEIFSTTLHLAPCKVVEPGFHCMIILPKGTNEELSADTVNKRDTLLWKKNKWAVCHPEHQRFVNQGVPANIVGSNIKIHSIG